MVTDTKRILRTDPGRPEVCNVCQLHRFFGDDYEEIWDGERTARTGCVDTKKLLAKRIIEHYASARERYAELMANPSEIDGILSEGADRLRPKAMATMEEVRDEDGPPLTGAPSTARSGGVGFAHAQRRPLGAPAPSPRSGAHPRGRSRSRSSSSASPAACSTPSATSCCCSSSRGCWRSPAAADLIRGRGSSRGAPGRGGGHRLPDDLGPPARDRRPGRRRRCSLDRPVHQRRPELESQLTILLTASGAARGARPAGRPRRPGADDRGQPRRLRRRSSWGRSSRWRWRPWACSATCCSCSVLSLFIAIDRDDSSPSCTGSCRRRSRPRRGSCRRRSRGRSAASCAAS